MDSIHPAHALAGLAPLDYLVFYVDLSGTGVPADRDGRHDAGLTEAGSSGFAAKDDSTRPADVTRAQADAMLSAIAGDGAGQTDGDHPAAFNDADLGGGYGNDTDPAAEYSIAPGHGGGGDLFG